MARSNRASSSRSSRSEATTRTSKPGCREPEDAAKYGATIQVFNGEFDGEKQLNQVMSAIASGDFDGFVLEANNPQQLCSAAKATLEAGIVLAVTNVPVCDAPYTGLCGDHHLRRRPVAGCLYPMVYARLRVRAEW